MKKTQTGAAAFETYYAKCFSERWAGLKKALLSPARQTEYTENLLKPYYLDYASIRAAETLPALEGGKCLDMCAAPGGKTLVLLNTMSTKTEITANEISAERRNRLIKVLNEHLSEERRRQIRVTGFNACVMPRFEQNAYERILLDAPCSSERHVLQNEKYLKQWSKARIRNLAQRQWALLSAAFLLLKPEGFLLYATCAISDEENDKTVQRLTVKYKEKAVIQPLTLPPLAEKTEYGCRFLPDKAEGAGPLFFSLIRKAPAQQPLTALKK